MKRNLLIAVMFVAAAAFAVAQPGNPTSDVLGAHLNYGRGCAACHAPHSGAYGNGAAVAADTNAGGLALWGQDLGNLYNATYYFAGSGLGTLDKMPASLSAGTPEVTGVIMCLSCHDGNLATGAMMKNQIYETLTNGKGTGYGSGKIPTLLGQDGTAGGNFLNDHPVGINATVGCGGQYNWDCTETNGVISMTGANSAQFVQNYGFFVSLTAYNSTAVVTCTSCHNQHSMNVVNVQDTNTKGTVISGLTPGNYKTMFFIRAPYNPNTTTANSNQDAQFCRQCHGGESNEMNGYSATTIF